MKIQVESSKGTLFILLKFQASASESIVFSTIIRGTLALKIRVEIHSSYRGSVPSLR